MASVPYATTATILNTVAGPTATLGGAITDFVGFYGEAGCAQRALAAQGTLSISAITSSTPYGFASKADADALLAQVAEIVATLTATGLWKGAA